MARNAACGISARTGTRADGRRVGILSLRTEGMTTEEKAKAWDEAIERAKSKIRNDKDHVLYEEDILDIFPSLKESDEERIRKDIVFYIAAYHKDDGEKARWLYWLEKQCEYANFRNKIQIGDKVTRNEDGVLVNLSQLNRVAKKDEKQGKNNMGISETTKQEWSEEDETKLNDAINACKAQYGNMSYTADWLLSLKERFTWKPSDEQIKAIRLARSFVTDDFDEHPALSEILIELEKQLKKLREEKL